MDSKGEISRLFKLTITRRKEPESAA